MSALSVSAISSIRGAARAGVLCWGGSAGLRNGRATRVALQARENAQPKTLVHSAAIQLDLRGHRETSSIKIPAGFFWKQAPNNQSPPACPSFPAFLGESFVFPRWLRLAQRSRGPGSLHHQGSRASARWGESSGFSSQASRPHLLAPPAPPPACSTPPLSAPAEPQQTCLTRVFTDPWRSSHRRKLGFQRGFLRNLD